MTGLPWTLLTDLRCPCCGSGLDPAVALAESEVGLVHGTLCCDCYEYPVVQGIPILRQIGPVSSTANESVDCLRDGDWQGALRWLLGNASAPGVPGAGKSGRAFSGAGGSILGRLVRRLRVTNARAEVADVTRLDGIETVLRASRPGNYAHYLFHRFANPSFLAAVPPLIVLGDLARATPRGRMLDLLSGIGHSSATVGGLCPELQVVMADVDFVNLYIGRRFLFPKAAAICMDVELPLPFAKRSFDGVVCLDGLHYVRSKVALLSEIDRIVGANGAWLFAHMHNADGSNINPGAPLTAKGYADRFSFGQRRILPETLILRQFQETGALDLTDQPGFDALESSDALTLLGARAGSLWRRHELLDEALCRRAEGVAFNPLYRFERAAGGLLGRAAWPTKSLQQECGAEVNLFSEEVRLCARTLSEIAAVRAGQPLTEDVRRLLRSFVLVPLPECYPHQSSLVDEYQ